MCLWKTEFLETRGEIEIFAKIGASRTAPNLIDSSRDYLVVGTLPDL